MLGLADNKKKMASLIIANINPSKLPHRREDESEREGDEKDNNLGYESCAEEMFDAIAKKDKMAFIDALGAYFDLKYNELEGNEHETMKRDDESEEGEYRRSNY